MNEFSEAMLTIAQDTIANIKNRLGLRSSTAAPFAWGLTDVVDEQGIGQPWGLVQRVYDNAAKSFQPRRLDVHGLLFNAEEEIGSEINGPDPTLGWKRLFAGGIDVTILPGNHNSIFGPDRPSAAWHEDWPVRGRGASVRDGGRPAARRRRRGRRRAARG